MLIHITVKTGDREDVLSQEVVGTASQREELAHQLGRRVGCVAAQAALQEQAEQLSRPHCCGHPMENRGWRTKTLQGLDGPLLIRRRRYRCRRCGREHLPADAHQQCGSHRLTRPLAKRICQLATIEHVTHLPQLVFDADRRAGGPSAFEEHVHERAVTAVRRDAAGGRMRLVHVSKLFQLSQDVSDGG